MLMQLDIVRALKQKEHDKSVRCKAEEIKLHASVADLASKPARAAKLNDLQRQLASLQQQLATRQASTTTSTK